MSKSKKIKPTETVSLTGQFKSKTPVQTKRKKIKKGLSKSKKKELWDTFDDEIGDSAKGLDPSSDSEDISKNKKL